MEQRVTVLPDIDGIRVIACTGEYDEDTLGPLREALARAGTDRVPRIVLDLGGVTFADSSMLNELIRVHTTHALVLAGPLPSQLTRLFEVTSADQIFTIVDSIEAARAL
ncbi:STAS domain-containing protein [Streptomyces sp. NPDC002104]